MLFILFLPDAEEEKQGTWVVSDKDKDVGVKYSVIYDTLTFYKVVCAY